uniref:Uncharacterized protein n=1 Tax=viral metagenome TaxID=1070528 RepID=A0A6C0J6D9_9ZZZZ
MDSSNELENIITFNDDEIIQNIDTENKNKYYNKSYGIRCAQSQEEFHSSTDINTCGHRSLKLDLWFCSKFNYNLYCYENHLGHYKESHRRVKDAHIFRRYLSNVKSNEE